MKATTSQEPALTVVNLTNAFESTDLETLVWVEEELYIAVDEFTEAEYFILDLTKVPYLGAAFLSVLVRLAKRIRKRNCRLVIATTGFGAEVIRVTNLDHLIVTLSSLDAALHWCRTGEFRMSDMEVPSAHTGFTGLPRCNPAECIHEKLFEDPKLTVSLCRVTVRLRSGPTPPGLSEDATRAGVSSRSTMSTASH